LLASKVPDIVSDKRIEILSPTNIHLDIHEGIYLYLAGLKDQPPATLKWPDIIFDVRIKILTITNLHLDMHNRV
jgi:hypothetical protein